MVIDKLRHEFWLGSEETNEFMYLDVNIRLLDKTVFLSQKDMEKIVPPRKSLLDTQVADSRSKMRSLVGKLQWVASQTRPYLSFRVASLATVTNVTISDITQANKIVRQLI